MNRSPSAETDALDRTTEAAESTQAVGVLFVDDEPYVLSALNRLFRREGYALHFAESAAKALEILEQQPIGVVVSDMRMPGTNGAALLAAVADRWPRTLRILLTAFADFSDAVNAVNRGHIYHYLNKPWQDDHLLLVVRRATESYQLSARNLMLERHIVNQNRELKQLNEHLEQLVDARTAELREAAEKLDRAYAQLHGSFDGVVRTLSHVIEQREEHQAGHARRVARLAQRMAERLELPATEVETIQFAGVLHQIGMVGMPEELMRLPQASLDAGMRARFNTYPACGEAALTGLEFLHPSAKLIRHHLERYDGRGIPDGLAGADIPLGARILAIAKAYDAAQLGLVTARFYTPEEAHQYVHRGAGSLFDPELVLIFDAVIGDIGQQAAEMTERFVRSDELRPGQILSRDLYGANRMLLLSEGHRFSESLIERIKELERSDNFRFNLYIQTDDTSSGR